MKAMILAAGLGTRLQPLTNDKPKALVEVGGMTMLEITIRYLKKNGVDEIVINVHHFADQVIEYLEKNKGFGLRYEISDERDQLMNTGGALIKARSLLENVNSFILMGVDVFTDLDLGAMWKKHNESEALVTLAVKDRKTTRSLLFDKQMQLSGWCDNRSGESIGISSAEASAILGFSVVHILNSQIFNLIIEEGAFSIMDLYLRLMTKHKILGFRHDETDWLEFGRAAEIEIQQESEEFKRLVSLL